VSLFRELQRRNVIRVATAYVVAAWLIIQVVETLFPVFGLGDAWIRRAVILLAIGLVPAIALAWVFQSTPEGLKLDKGGQQSVPGAGRRLDRAIIVTFGLAIVYFAVDKFVLAPERMAEREAEVAAAAVDEARKGFYGDRSIAVMPFENLSSDPEQAYFADGVAEEVLNLLARIRELRVISRSSAFALKGMQLEIPEIAERLDVAHVLEGSVRRAGNRVRVTAQLIDARTDTHLWSQTYDRELDDVFLIQDEIAADVARNLQIALLEPPRSRYVHPEVLALTEQAKMLAETRPDDVGVKMVALLDEALAIDPDYVPALEWMVSANFLLRLGGGISIEEEQARYERLAEHARRMDPGNAFFDATDAYTLTDEGRLEEAAELYLQALSKDMSDSNLVRLAGGFARQIGKFDASKRLLEHAVAIDPLCFMCIYHLSRTYLYAGDYELAERARERYLAIGRGGDYHYGLLLLLKGEPQAALDHYASVQGRFPESPQYHAGMAMARHSLGETDKARAELEQLLNDTFREKANLVSEVAAWMGDADMAFEWLYKVENISHGGIIFHPLYRSLHDDPRWAAYRESIGRSEARLEAIEFDPVMPE
jgi:TolB-like protein